MSCLPTGLVAQKLPQQTPSRIIHAFRQLGFRQRRNVQVFDADDVILLNQTGREPMKELATLDANTMVLTGKLPACLLAVRAVLLAAREAFVETAVFAFRAPIPLRSGHVLAITQHGEILQAQIDADGAAGVGREKQPFGHGNLRDERDVPGAGRVLGKRSALQHTLGRPVHHQPYPARFRHYQVPVLEAQILRDTERGALAPFGLEARERGPALEEVGKRPAQVAQGLLERLSVHLSQPRGCRLVLQRGQLLAQCGKRQGCARRLIVRLPSGEPPVVHEASGTCIVPKQQLLLLGREHAIAIHPRLARHTWATQLFKRVFYSSINHT